MSCHTLARTQHGGFFCAPHRAGPPGSHPILPEAPARGSVIREQPSLPHSRARARGPAPSGTPCPTRDHRARCRILRLRRLRRRIRFLCHFMRILRRARAGRQTGTHESRAMAHISINPACAPAPHTHAAPRRPHSAMHRIKYALRAREEARGRRHTFAPGRAGGGVRRPRTPPTAHPRPTQNATPARPRPTPPHAT